MIGRTAGSIRRNGEEVQDGETLALERTEQPAEGFEVNPGKAAYGGAIGQYEQKLNAWPEGIARKSTEDSVTGQFFELWSQRPKGTFPVATATDEVLASAGASGRAVSASAEQVTDALAGGAAAADYAQIQSVLDAGQWVATDAGWTVVQGGTSVDLVMDALGRLLIDNVVFG